MNTKNVWDKFDSKSDEGIFLGYSTRKIPSSDLESNEGIFLGYSTRSKAYRIYNKRTLTIEESLHVNFDEYITKNVVNIDENENNFDNSNNEVNTQDKIEPDNNPKEWQYVSGHPKELIIDEVSKGVLTRSKLDHECATYVFISSIEPKNVVEACSDDFG